MTLDALLDAFADDDTRVAAIGQALADWDEVGPACRSLLHGFVTGADVSEAHRAGAVHHRAPAG